MTGTAALLRRWLCRLEWSECRRLEPAHFKREQLRRTRGWRKPTYQILTKRSRRLRRLSSELSWPANVWMGVSVEDQARTYREQRT